MHMYIKNGSGKRPYVVYFVSPHGADPVSAYECEGGALRAVNYLNGGDGHAPPPHMLNRNEADQ